MRRGPDSFVTRGGSASGRDRGKWTSGRALLLCAWPATRGPWTCWLLLGLDALPFPWALFSGCPGLPPILVQGERAPSPRERVAFLGEGRTRPKETPTPRASGGGRRRFNWAELMSLSTRRKAKSPKRLCWNLVHFTMYLVHFENILPFQI